MKLVNDARAIEEAAATQRGVFSKADLQTLLAEPHPSAFARRARALEEHGLLRRFCRGFYVTDTFDLPTLSQRINPDSYVSFGTVLARELLIGPRSARRVVAVKTGKSRTYEGLGYEVVHLHVTPHLFFGYAPTDGVRFADAEKAVLDVLYFHLRGRRYPFDIYSDVDYGRLDRRRLDSYLGRYRNPKFVAFARGLLRMQ
jgi:hypothetical protein